MLLFFVFIDLNCCHVFVELRISPVRICMHHFLLSGEYFRGNQNVSFLLLFIMYMSSCKRRIKFQNRMKYNVVQLSGIPYGF